MAQPYAALRYGSYNPIQTQPIFLITVVHNATRFHENVRILLAQFCSQSNRQTDDKQTHGQTDPADYIISGFGGGTTRLQYFIT